jgi:hypothetical protein
MKATNYTLIGMLLLLVTSCGTTVTLPVSEVTPAAEITVKRKADKSDNYKINVTAKYLASPERLSPPRSAYVVWIKTSDGYKSIGQLGINNAKKAELNTLSPHAFSEVLITAEDSGNTTQPTGTYISSTNFEK